MKPRRFGRWFECKTNNVTLFAEFNAAAINRPTFSAHWWGEDEKIFELYWGNGLNDPVWRIGVMIRFPRWVITLVDNWCKIGRITLYVCKSWHSHHAGKF